MSNYASDYLLPDFMGAHFLILGLDIDHPDAAGTLLFDKTTCATDGFGEIDLNNCMPGSDTPQETRLTLKQSAGSKQLFSIETRPTGTMTFQAIPLWLVLDKTDAMNPRLRLLAKRDAAAPIERIIELYKN